jgi:uncharacterized protein involved in exopolysaccharide biosynthesis
VTTTQARTARDRLDRMFAILRRSLRFTVPALLLFLLGGAASVGYAFVRKRVFKSETLILYREGIRSTDIIGGEEVGDRAHKLGLRLKEMVLSRTRLEQIVKEFNLYPELPEIDAVDELRKHIAFRVQDGDTFGLSFEGNDPRTVQKVTARLADALLAENSKTHAEQAEVTKEFLDREKKRMEAALKDKETALAQFLAKHPEFAKESSQGAGGNQAGTAIRAAQNKSAPRDPMLASLEREAQRLQERLGMPTAKKKTSEPTGDPTLVQAKNEADAELRAAQKELQEKTAQFTDEHPDVRAARTRLKLAQDKLKKAQDALAANISTLQQKTSSKEEEEGTIDRGALENELHRINEEIAVYKAKHRSEAAPNGGGNWVVALETEWTRLNREVVDAREQFQSLQDKQFKAAMVENAATSGRTAQMDIVDAAYLPMHAAKPGRSTIAGIGMAISIMLSLMLAIALALVDDRLYDRVDIERLEMLPLIGVVPRAHKRKRAHG